MKIHLFHFSPYGLARILGHLVAGYRLCRACGARLRPFVPDSINSMTAAWNTLVIWRRNALSPPATIIDIGANRNQMTRLLRLAAAADVHVISFEPNADLHPDGEVFREALGDRDGDGELFVPDGESCWGTTIPPRERQGTAAIPIRFRRFDSLVRDGIIAPQSLPAPVLVKIDTEGAEYAVLSGFGRELGWVDYLLVEVENREERGGLYSLTGLSTLLYSHGFDKAAVVSSGFNGPDLPPYMDILFWRTAGRIGG